MLKTAVRLFGITLVLVGVLGFVPAVSPHEMLLGVFHVNFAHNLVHLISGVIALFAAAAGPSAPRTFFRVFGVAYGLVAVLGFFAGNSPILGLISNNVADTWLHVVISLTALALGFAVKEPLPRSETREAGTAWPVH